MLIDSFTKKFILETYQRVQSPFYLFDERILNKQWHLLRRTLPPRTVVHYATMANNDPETLSWFRKKGSRIFVGSWEHLKLVESLGFSDDQIVSGITNLSVLQIADLLSRVDTIILSTEAELESASTVPGSRHFLIRVNVAEPKKKFRGGVRTMGVNPELVKARWDSWIARDSRLVGIHSYAGTNVQNLDVLARRARRVVKLSNTLTDVRIVDLGGGFPATLETSVSDQELVRFWNAATVDRASNTELWVEPGRFLVAPTSLFIAAVNSIHTETRPVNVGADASVFMFPRRFLFGAADSEHPLYVLSSAPASQEEHYWETAVVTGNTTFSRDVLYQGRMPQTRVGDLLIFGNAGAYCRASIPRFLGTVAPPEIRIAEKIKAEEILHPTISQQHSATVNC